MDSQYVWALLGLLCLLIMFTMMALGVRNVRDEEDLAPEPVLDLTRGEGSYRHE